jgi:mannose/fructose/N-acetylgalactosamine-specific phosphotransferase system component IIB
LSRAVVECFTPLLARIDDRLIHGQVVVGCCEPLGADRIVLVDDAVAGDSLHQKLYRAAAPPAIDVHFVTVDGACALMEELAGAGTLGRCLVVVARALTMARLHDARVRFSRVQLGGAHAREGAQEIAPGFFLDFDDRQALRDVVEAGAEVFIQPVSASASKPLRLSMLDEGGE